MKKLILVFGVCILFTVPSMAETIVVDPNGSGDFTNIQDAINYSWHGDTILVYPGSYNENIFFNGRAITLTSADPNTPNIVDATVITNSSGYCIRFEFGEGKGSIVTGFTITGTDGGIYCNASSPIIRKNVIKNGGGSGIYGDSFASPYITDNEISHNANRGIYGCDGNIEHNTISYNGGGLQSCNGSINNNTIINNNTSNSGGGLLSCSGSIFNNQISGNTGNYGGGLSGCRGSIDNNIISGNHTSTFGHGGGINGGGSITNNLITGNSAHTGGGISGGGSITGNTIKYNVGTWRAGAIHNCDGDITYNIITHNSSGGRGAGLYGCDGTIMNNIIAENTCDSWGGGLSECSGIIISNNTIVGNQSEWAAGLHNCSTVVKNNIIAFNNATDDVGAIYGSCSNSYNAFWMNGGGNFGGGASMGIGDIAVDPLFVDIDSNDYHLKSEVGRWNPNTETWVTDTVTTYCIDAGDPSGDIGQELNPNGARINMGAYGGTWEASKSTGGTGPEPPPRCLEYPAMDFNKDCKVNFTDFSIFVQSWLECNLDPPGACWE